VRHSPFSYGSPAPKRMRSGLLLIVIIGVIVLFSVLVTFLSNDSSSTELDSTLSPEVVVDIPTEFAEPSEVPAATAIPVQTAEPPITAGAISSDVMYQTIQKAYGTMSTADWVTFARSLVNRHVQWRGKLIANHTSEELWFTMDTSALEGIPETALHLSEAGQLITPGEMVYFEGDISRIVVFSRQVLVHLRNGQITTTQN
jgi:hypothetical protein